MDGFCFGGGISNTNYLHEQDCKQKGQNITITLKRCDIKGLVAREMMASSAYKATMTSSKAQPPGAVYILREMHRQPFSVVK